MLTGTGIAVGELLLVAEILLGLQIGWPVVFIAYGSMEGLVMFLWGRREEPKVRAALQKRLQAEPPV